MLDELFALFTLAGAFTGASFNLDRQAASGGGIYLWVRRTASGLVVLRVGCTVSFWDRYNGKRGYNSWLAGIFGREIDYEQARRCYTLRTLEAGDEVWVLRHDFGVKLRRSLLKKLLRLLEKSVREHFAKRGHSLAVDGVVKGSQIRRDMNAWRDAGRPSVWSDGVCP